MALATVPKYQKLKSKTSQKIKEITANCLSCDSKMSPGNRFSGNLLQTLRTVKKRAIVVWLIMMSNGLIYVVKPFLSPGRRVMDDAFIYYGLDPMLDSPNYEIALTVTILAIFFACYTAVNTTAFLIVTGGYVEAQMLAWSEEIRLIWEDAENHYNNYKESATQNEDFDKCVVEDHVRTIVLDEFVKERLKTIIKGHATNINLVHQIEDVFRGATALEFFIVVVGLIAELLGGLENTYLEVPFTFLQVALDCFAGQRLMDASVEFEAAVFDCKWENFHKSNRKLVLLILQNAQKRMTLSAGGIVMLNFSSLMFLIRSVYSAYTTLRTTMASTIRAG